VAGKGGKMRKEFVIATSALHGAQAGGRRSGLVVVSTRQVRFVTA